MKRDDVTAEFIGWLDGFTARGSSLSVALDLLSLCIALKLDDEYSRPPYDRERGTPADASWPELVEADGPEVVGLLNALREQLQGQETTLAQLSRLTSIPDEPARLAALVAKVNDTNSLLGAPSWLLGQQLAASSYDQLLVDLGEDGRLPLIPTARPLTSVLAQLMQPAPGDEMWDVAAGSGAFLIEARHVAHSAGDLDRVAAQQLKSGALRARELRPDQARWCSLNLLLHGIGDLSEPPIVETGDTLAAPDPGRATLVITNPDFGRDQASLLATLTEGSRNDIRLTGNRQIDMLQHVVSMLKPQGRAAAILPDNVLFETGAGAHVRRQLLDTCDLHTVLRLPTGISAKGGVKANVLFFTKKPARAEPWTTETWFYDFRTNKHFTLKRHKLTRDDLQEFVDAYSAGDRSQREESERFKKFTYKELVARDGVNLDITWLKDDDHLDLDDLPDPDVLAAEIADDLYAMANEMREMSMELEDPV